ncbi:MAG: ABC transporter permease [Armatimonadota bacterium]
MPRALCRYLGTRTGASAATRGGHSDEGQSSFVKIFTGLWRWRQAVSYLVKRDLKVRYKNSALGFFWSFLNPLTQIIVMTIAFRYIIQIDMPNYSVQLFVVFLPWMFFMQTLGDGADCVAQDAALIKKFAFPRIILPISKMLSNFVHMLFGYVVLIAIFIYLGIVVHTSFALVPVFFIIQMIFMLGLVLIFSVLRMYYDDIRFILEALLRLWFYLTPIAYNIEHVLSSAQIAPFLKNLYIMANPLTPLMIGYRKALLEAGQWPMEQFWGHVGLSAELSILILVIGLLVWRRHSWQFPELL